VLFSRQLRAPLLGLCLLCLASCRDHDTPDIVIDRLRIADLATGDEITQPTPGQHVGLEMIVKTPGLTSMVRYVFSQGDSVIADILTRGSGADRFARSGLEIVLPDRGTTVFRVVADPEDLFVEEHEDNNQAELTVTVNN
jgi:hypothetical protein